LCRNGLATYTIEDPKLLKRLDGIIDMSREDTAPR
jgi:hypothetical protein